MKYYKIQNRSQKNYQSCVPFNMSIFSFLHAYLYYMSPAIAVGIGGVLQHVWGSFFRAVG
jgi:hypothetical protein